MNRKRGAISVFALLSMMFFLIFIMVAYNNVTQKAKTQVETEGLLVDYYKPTITADQFVESLDGGVVSSSNQDQLLKKSAQGAVTTGNSGKYVYSNGKIYKIQ